MSYWKDKVVAVTGGSSGFGRVLAEAYSAAGAKVVIAARGAEALNAAAREMSANGIAVEGYAADVTAQSQVDALFDHIKNAYGRLDALVNNVGRSVRGQILDTTPEKFQELLNLNFLGVVRCTRAAAPMLLESKGHLVNIASLAARSAGRYVAAYPVTKFAVAAYSQQLRLELQDKGLHVLLVCPGPIQRDDAGVRYADDAGQLPESAMRPGAGVKVKSLDPQVLAQEILRACELRKLDLVRPKKARLLFVLSQFSPGLGDWLVRKMT